MSFEVEEGELFGLLGQRRRKNPIITYYAIDSAHNALARLEVLMFKTRIES